MGVFGALKSIFTRRPSQPTIVQARYDAAQTTTDNARYWSAADNLSADAANSLAIRKLIRERARYEVANNPVAYGMITTLANDVVGTTPRLQVTMPDISDADKDLIEARWHAWTKAVRLPSKLRTLKQSADIDGEAFAVIVDNPRIRSPLSLDVVPVECDRVSDPDDLANDPLNLDGVILDEYGNVDKYRIMDEHPGGVVVDYTTTDWPSEDVIHWFKSDRPGQHRGISALTPALPLFRERRLYLRAVVEAARNAASIPILMKTQMLPSGSAPTDIDAQTAWDIPHNFMMYLPDGWDPFQIKSEQPTTTFSEFNRELLAEIARCLNMPEIVAAQDSSGSNYSSARFDDRNYIKAIGIQQYDLGCEILDLIFARWIEEAVLIEGYLPQSVRYATSIDHEWYFDGRGHVDPTKEAQAEQIRLDNGTTTLKEIGERGGVDWKKRLEQRAREKAAEREAGVSDDAAQTQEADDAAN